MGVYSEFEADIEELFIEGDRRFDIDLVGSSDYQHFLTLLSRSASKRGLDAEFIAKLHYEYSNADDDYAIRVVVSGKTVGYLAHEDSKRYRARLKRVGMEGIIVACKAIVSGGKRVGLFRRSPLGVSLDLPIMKL